MPGLIMPTWQGYPAPYVWTPRVFAYPQRRCCCGGGPCDWCDGTTPSQFQTTIAGIVESFCGSCDALNTTYVLEQTDGLPFCDVGVCGNKATGEECIGCRWIYQFDPVTCGVEALELTLDNERFRLIMCDESKRNGWAVIFNFLHGGDPVACSTIDYSATRADTYPNGIDGCTTGNFWDPSVTATLKAL